MNEPINLQETKKFFESLVGCCLDQGSYDRLEDAVEVSHFTESIPDEEAGAGVFKMKDGTYLVFEESQDYSGHGCRCCCDVAGPFPDLETAIRMGLTKSARKNMDLALPEDVNE